MVMNDGAQAIIALGVCATVAISVISIGRAYVRNTEAERKAARPDIPPEVQDRMTRIEQAVDAIAIEVERMSEGQRFTTRLLAEQFGESAKVDARATQSLTRHSDIDRANGAGGNHAS